MLSKFKQGDVVAGYGRFGIVQKVIGNRVDFETYEGETIRGVDERLRIVNPDNYFPRWIDSKTATQREYDYLKGVTNARTDSKV